MFRHYITIALLFGSTAFAHAEQAGTLIFVSGNATVAATAAVLGAPVQEGAHLATGRDGYIYVKTVDNGLFVLRPNSEARISAYHVDRQNPANTRIKFELINGVARSRSGDAVKAARQNFRFNTPIAAIGVRGTDFTVFTDQNTSRVAVVSGGITMSGFTAGCSPEGSGPCEGGASRELSAAQRGHLLQVQRGQLAPQLLSSGVLSPDALAPPRPDEPIAKTGANSVVAAEPSLDPQKSISIGKVSVPQVPAPAMTPTLAPAPDVPQVAIVAPTPEPSVVVVVAPVSAPPQQQIVWGRFAAVLERPANIDLAAQAKANAELIALKGNYALLRTDGERYVTAANGSVGFSLKSGEAYIYNDDMKKAPVAAKIENGQLSVDFGKATFMTSFDLANSTEVFKLKAEGAVGSNGRLFGNSQFVNPTNMSVDGVLSNQNGGSAAYLFQGRLDATRSANGVTIWGR